MTAHQPNASCCHSSLPGRISFRMLLDGTSCGGVLESYRYVAIRYSNLCACLMVPEQFNVDSHRILFHLCTIFMVNDQPESAYFVMVAPFFARVSNGFGSLCKYNLLNMWIWMLLKSWNSSGSGRFLSVWQPKAWKCLQIPLFCVVGS